MFLLSTEGERHEDRIPMKIVTSLDSAREYLKEKFPTINFLEEISETDYNDNAVLFFDTEEETAGEEIGNPVICEKF